MFARWTINKTRYPYNLHIESLNDQMIARLYVDGAFDPTDFRLPTLTGSIRVQKITPKWIWIDTFNTTTRDQEPMSYKNFVLDRPQFAREFFEQQAWTCYKQSSAHMAPVDAIGSSNPYMIHTSIPAPHANPGNPPLGPDPNPVGDPLYTDEEMNAIGYLYRIPLRVRQEAAHVSCVDFEYGWPWLLQTLPEGSVVRIDKLFYKYARVDNHLERIRMLELRVVGTDARMRMEYDAFMHVRDLNHNLIDISQYRL